MISNIGLSQNIKIFSTPCFKAKQDNTTVTNPVDTTNLNGINALASYNYNLVNKSDKFDIPILEPLEMPKDINSIDGEKVFDSKGELQCVVKEDENHKIIYRIDNRDNTINDIEVIDKSTGNTVLSQNVFEIENHDKTFNKHICVTSYDSINGIESTVYKDGELCYKNSETYHPDGSHESMSYDYSDNIYTYYNHNGNNLGHEKIYDVNKNLISENIYETKPDGYYKKEIKYSNSKPISISTKNRVAKGVENNKYKNYLNDPNLKPTPCPEFITDISNIDGIKTYYSNGQIESVKTPDGKLYEASLFGNSITLHDDNKTIEFIKESGSDKHRCFINEKLGDAVKITNYFDTKNIQDFNVTYTKDNISKFLSYEKGVPSMYNECDESKEDDNLIIGINYAPNGSITDVYHSFDELDF